MKAAEKIIYIKKALNELYPDAGCTLQYKDPLQLLIATQLATQCTDARVNMVCKDLFQKYKTVEDFANSNQEELEQDIKSTGFYRNKAKNIIGTCKLLLRDYNGQVPGNMDDLLKLPGVGRKIANLILGDVFGIPGIVVDTHCIRLANRIGLTKDKNPLKIEKNLLKIVPKDYQTKFCHQLVEHGRAVCTARKCKCDICKIRNYCNFYKNKNKSTKK
jgi:endonuclease-3